MVTLETGDIQGNILRGYGFPHATYLFLEVPDPASGCAFLAAIVDEVTTAEHWDEAPATTTNVALTYAGLRALGVADDLLGTLPDAFRAPIRIRAPGVLGDIGRSAPDAWDEGIGTERSHLLVTIGGSSDDDATAFDAAVADVIARAEQHGLVVVHRQDAQGLDNRREHFGWADGFGQPAVEGVGNSRAGQGVPQGDGITWRDVKSGEFVLGYPDEDGQTVATPFLRNGSYMVYRKLYQDVARFRRELYAEAARYGATLEPDPPLDGDQLYELMAAKVVGRWRDGVALELVDRRTEAESRWLGDQARERPDNDFRYFDDDRAGLRCPRGAHTSGAPTRVTRSAGNGELTRSHRIIRRGMPYGEPLPAGAYADDGEDRGLIFICMNADIARQFELLQSLWCNDGNAFGLGDDKDYLLGDNTGTGTTTIQGDPPHFASAQADVVLTRGCEYLLVPGIAALRSLAAQR